MFGSPLWQTKPSFVAIGTYGSGDIMIVRLPNDLRRERYQRLMWLYGQEPMKISYHPAKFCSHRNSDSGDIVALVCHVISQDHVIKESCDFIDSIPWR